MGCFMTAGTLDLGLSASRNVRNQFLLGVSPTVYGIQFQQIETLVQRVLVPLVLTFHTLPYYGHFQHKQETTWARIVNSTPDSYLNSSSFTSVPLSIQGPRCILSSCLLRRLSACGSFSVFPYVL